MEKRLRASNSTTPRYKCLNPGKRKYFNLTQIYFFYTITIANCALVQNHKCCAHVSLYKLVMPEREVVVCSADDGQQARNSCPELHIFFIGITWFFSTCVCSGRIWVLAGFIAVAQSTMPAFFNSGFGSVLTLINRSGEGPRLQTRNVWAWSAAHTSGKVLWISSEPQVLRSGQPL